MTTRIEPPASASTRAAPASGLLSAWTAHDWRDGIHVADLVALETLVVATQNSVYEIVLVAADSARVLTPSLTEMRTSVHQPTVVGVPES